MTRASQTDLPAILKLQRLAFDSEAVSVGDLTISPLTQTLEEIEAEFELRLFLKLEESGNLVASVRGHKDEAGGAHVGRLMVHPTRQGEGLGSNLMHEIEHELGPCRGFKIFTSAASTGNIRLYERLGYCVFAREKVGALEMVFLTKEGDEHESFDD